MTKVALTDVANLTNEASAIATMSANNTIIENAFDNTLSRDGTSPNTMGADLDMNSHYVLNLPDPTQNQHAVTKAYGDAHYGDSLVQAQAAAASASAAAASDASAASHDTSAAAHDTSAAAHDAAAATSATNAATSETNAATSATNAAASAGVIGAQWTFDATTTMADPGTGKIRLNNATVASVTAIAVSDSDAESGNPNIKNYILSWDDSTNTVKGYLVLRKLGTPSTYAIFSVTGTVTDNTTWCQLSVTYVSSNGVWSAADTVVAGFTRAGDKGTNGTVAISGTPTAGHIATWFDGTTIQDGGALAASATTDTTNASNISSGTLAAARGGAGTVNGVMKANGAGTVSAAVAGTDYLAPAAIGSTVQAFDAQLSSTVPQNSQSAAYTTVLTDGEKQILHPSTDNNARTFTIAANASVAYPIGTTITFVNLINTVTIAIATDTLIQAGTGSTGSRTLAANGIATAVKVASTTWLISGVGLT